MNSFYSRFLIVATCMFSAVFSFALDATQFDDPAQLERYKTLTEELRCLVCQNETIAGSSAPLALDLRNQVAEQIKAGQSDEQIRNYMSERYGEFIHYRPGATGAAKFLWIAPLVFLLLAGLVFILVVKNRTPDLDDEDIV